MTNEPGTGSKGKVLKILLWSLLSIVVLCLTAAGILASMIFEKVPIVLDHNYLRRPKDKEPFIPFYVMRKGQNNYDIMKDSKPGTRSTIYYEDDEFNYILRNVLFSNILNQAGATGGKRITAKRTSLILKNGAFHLKYILDTPDNPFGKYLNLYFVFKIAVKDGKDHLEILTAKAGSLDIPKFILDRKLQEIIRKYYSGTAQERLIKSCIIDLHLDQNGIFAEYSPYVLKQEIKHLSGGAAGVFLGQLGYDDAKK
ncbi:MAG: hypothetical protein IJW23_08275 [Lentisphaeria bacterium]|nr:hypothetical protein [Lentisphaeria bacterium]